MATKKTPAGDKYAAAYAHGAKLRADGTFPTDDKQVPAEYRGADAGSEKAHLRACFYAGGYGEPQPEAPAKFS